MRETLKNYVEKFNLRTLCAKYSYVLKAIQMIEIWIYFYSSLYLAHANERVYVCVCVVNVSDC